MTDLPSPLTVATKRISELEEAATLTGPEILPVVQSGSTHKITVTQLVANVASMLPDSGGDHGDLTGLADDDHPQYHNDARGDLRYAAIGHSHAGTYDPAGSAAAAQAASTPIAHVGSGGSEHANVVAGGSSGFMSGADKTKLDGVAVGATANSSDAALRDRTTHTGTQVASTISDFNEAVDDRVATLLVQGSGITLTYNDAAGTLTVAASGGGSDPWTYVKLGTDFTTNSATAVDVTGLAFTPAANSTYEFEGLLRTRTTATAIGPRPGLAWPTGTTDGVAGIDMTSSATARLLVNGNPSATLLAAVGGLPNTTQSFPAWISGNVTTGASPSGSVKVQLASETAGTDVTIKAGSYIRYRLIP